MFHRAKAQSHIHNHDGALYAIQTHVPSIERIHALIHVTTKYIGIEMPILKYSLSISLALDVPILKTSTAKATRIKDKQIFRT